MDCMAADLRDRGYTFSNLEYRRIGHPGGGYPGTFQDIAAGLDHLLVQARQNRLDLRRVAVSGHSAGGHLALWTGARERLPSGSALGSASPLPIQDVVSPAGITDLDAYDGTGPDACDGRPTTIDGLVGLQQPGRRDVFADTPTGPAAPWRPPDRDLGRARPHCSTAVRKGLRHRRGRSRQSGPFNRAAGAGHFEVIDPTSAVWSRILGTHDGLLR